MAKGFTDIAIKNLKAGEVRREIPDPGCAGLYLVLQPSGSRSWAVRYRHEGKPKKLTLAGGLSLAAARKLTGDALLAVEQGRDPSEREEIGAVTVAGSINGERGNWTIRLGEVEGATVEKQPWRLLDEMLETAIADARRSRMRLASGGR